MKKAMFLGMVIFLFIISPVQAEKLKVGMKASDWSFIDSKKKDFTMASWPGKVLMINYVDPDKADLNEPFTEALKKASDEGKLSGETYRGMGIADCAATWKPNILIRKIAGRKAKKYKTTILFDYKAKLRNAWGLEKDTSNIIILDKDRVCHKIIYGKVPDDQIASLVQLVIDLQNK